MIIIDTHIFLWWVHGDERLTVNQDEIIKANEVQVIGVSAISCWEIAKLVEYKRINLHQKIDEWFKQAFKYPGVRLIELTPEIAIESTQLPGEFHHDPSDQIIVATAKIHSCPLVTSDSKIIKYSHVETVI